MRLLSSLVVLVAVSAAMADKSDQDGFVPMFNGKDLSGWQSVNTPTETFFVRDDMIITTGKPTGYLRTGRQYENFIAEFDWMHIPAKPGAVGNSGFFVWADPIPAVGTPYTRGIEVQVLVNLTYKNRRGEITATSQGDLFSIWGATCVPDRPHPDGSARCLPSENHCRGENEWNHYRVEANDGVLKLTVNGHAVSGVSKCSPRQGYLALEAEGSECRFRNLKIKELPSTNPKPAEVAQVDAGHKALFNGVNLEGWRFGQPPGQPGDNRWKVAGEKLVAGGTGSLATQKEFGPCELVFDWKVPARSAVTECLVSVGGQKRTVTLPPGSQAGSWSRQTIKAERVAGPAAIEFLPAEGLEIMNVFVRELKQ
jgi:hypothetical protein